MFHKNRDYMQACTIKFKHSLVCHLGPPDFPHSMGVRVSGTDCYTPTVFFKVYKIRQLPSFLKGRRNFSLEKS